MGTYLFCNPKQKDSLESIINKYESLHYTTLDENSKQVKEITNKLVENHFSAIGATDSVAINKSHDRFKPSFSPQKRYFLLYGESLSEKEFKSIENELLNERKWRKWTDEVFGEFLFFSLFILILSKGKKNPIKNFSVVIPKNRTKIADEFLQSETLYRSSMNSKIFLTYDNTVISLTLWFALPDLSH